MPNGVQGLRPKIRAVGEARDLGEHICEKYILSARAYSKRMFSLELSRLNLDGKATCVHFSRPPCSLSPSAETAAGLPKRRKLRVSLANACAAINDFQEGDEDAKQNLVSQLRNALQEAEGGHAHGE